MKQVIFNEEDGSFTFENTYNFPIFKKKLIDHFEDGGESKIAILAGVIGTSKATWKRWLDIASPYYKEELHQLIDLHKNKASATVAKQRRDASVGKYENWDAKLLSQRYKEIVENNGNYGLSPQTKAALMNDDLKHSILCLQKDLARERINPAQFKLLIETLTMTQDSDVRKMQEQLNELINEFSGRK